MNQFLGYLKITGTTISEGVLLIIVAIIAFGGGIILYRELHRMRRRIPAVRIEEVPRNLMRGRRLFESDALDPLKAWQFHSIYQNPEEIVAEEGIIRFDVRSNPDDRWAYIYLDPDQYRWSNYSWQLRIKRDTLFREFAFNFRYVDFDTRYRYRFERGRIFFDKKIKGEWFNNIASTPFEMKNDEWIDLRIDAFKTVFRCYVNEIMVLENADSDIEFGSICVILWETDRLKDVRACVSSIEVFELLPPSE